jgi:DNA invertase Pin-like site-specific DNA recombinase
MLTAGCYARKSNDEVGKDPDTKSCARQVQRAREYARTKGWKFDDRHVYEDDNVSGGEWVRRPGLNRLLDTLKDGRAPFQVLIVSEQSRIGRDVVRTLMTIKTLEDTGVEIWAYLDQARITLAEDTDTIREFIKGWSGEQERTKAGQRVRDRMRQKVERGEIVGRLPCGYTLRDGKPDIVEAEAEIIRRVFKRRASGAGYHVICRELERDGILSPRGLTTWCQSQIASITRNTLYHGVQTWGATKQVKKRGTIKTERAGAENIITSPMPTLRIVDEKLWARVQEQNQQANAACMRRAKDGTLLSRPSLNKHLLAGFIACGVCGGSMYIRKERQGSVKGDYFFCTTRHLGGKRKCSNARTLKVAHAENALMHAFEEALIGSTVLDTLDTCLDEIRRSQLNPAPLKAEAAGLKTEITRLVAQLAKGEVEEITDAVNDRKRRLVEIEGLLSGAETVSGVDVDEFRERVEEVLNDWRGHLRKHPSTARAVLHKILPGRITATPVQGGGWTFDGMTDYRAVLRECGLTAVEEVLKNALPKLSRKAAAGPWWSFPRERLEGWLGCTPKVRHRN